MRRIYFLCLLAVPGLILVPHVRAQFAAPNHVLASGGPLAGGDHAAYAVIGQSAIGAANNAAMVATLGFLPQQGIIVSTGIEPIHDDAGVPLRYRLDQNYPNPFNPTTKITFALPEPNHVTVAVYNVLGREVTVLADDEYAAGRYELTWNARDLPSGVYFYRMEAGSFVEVRQLVLLK